jgi:uncharacterized glyoxalase superfamily protein PhnB
VLVTRDVDAVHARVVRAGFRSKKDPWDAFWGQRYATTSSTSSRS